MTKREALKETLVKEYIISYNNSFNIKGIKNSSLYEEILNLFDESFRKDKSLKELIYLLFHPNEQSSICYNPSCTQSTNFLNNKKGYSQFCSNECYKSFLNLKILLLIK